MTEDHHRRKRHDRIRRTKRWLRFLPRRATVHRYPVLRSFAGLIRSKPYLWSFRISDVSPALHAGSILALLPLAGIQIPIALFLSILLRANLPLLVGLQFITNPLTVAPLWYATYQVGDAVLEGLGATTKSEFVDEELARELMPPEALESEYPSDKRRRGSLSRTFNALMIGGVFCGALLGIVLDVAYRVAARRINREIRQRAAVRGSGSTKTLDPPK